MYEWLWLMGVGLAMDIVGVWMLAGPLLKFDLRHKSVYESNIRVSNQIIEEDTRDSSNKIPKRTLVMENFKRISQLQLDLLK